MSNEQIMVDIECLDIRPTATILSIGAVRFDTTRVNGRFYQAVKVEGQNRSISAGTVKWWMQQSDEAKKVFTEESITLKEALFGFDTWAGKDIPVWGNGSDFDNAILQNAYEQHGLVWNHRRNRCYRTMKSICPMVKLTRTGTYHNAYDDAESQSSHLVAILKYMRVEL